MKYIGDNLIEHRHWQGNIFQRFGVQLLRVGLVPRHIGIIMDGNRRWANMRGEKALHGHIEGVRILDQVFHFAYACGVKEITAYALSTDNLKRSEEEVKDLMDLITAYWKRQIENKDNLNQRGFRIDLMGDIKMLPKSLQALSAKVSCLFSENKVMRLNLAICYKSTEEIDRVMSICKQGVRNGEIGISDIDEYLVENCLYTNESYPVDFLIRTSEEQIFSDFFLWQANRVPLYFCDVLWPDFKFIHFFKAILYFQQNYQKCCLRANANEAKTVDDDRLKRNRVNTFIMNVKRMMQLELEQMASMANNNM